MKTVLVTGANGQLGQCFQKQSKNYPEIEFLFCSSRKLDITSEEALSAYFQDKNIDYCINTAAYTNVEQAESEKGKAFLVNAEGAKNMAEICKKNEVVLFHFSTDYVFNGISSRPYTETDEVDPINIYGASKLKGEEEIQSILENYFILRTSWLYSEFGHNFFRTVLRKADENATLNITTSQIGTPTNANDLAIFVLQMITSESKDYGVYHVSNDGQATWYDFASAILDYSGKLDQVSLNKTGFFKTLAERPAYSVLSKEKFTTKFGPVEDWKKSLFNLINEINL